MQWLQRPEEGVRCPEAGVPDGCELCGCLGSTASSYTAETLLQLQIKLSKKFKRIAGIAWVLITGGEQ